MGEPVVEGRADTVIAAVKELATYLIGRDPSRIEDPYQVLYRGGFYRGGSGPDERDLGDREALWDIEARALGVPGYALLGGLARDRVRVYDWIGGDRPADLAAGEAGGSGFDIAVAPHCPLGPIAFAASLQLDACTPSVVIQEQSLGIHDDVGNDLLDYVVDRGAFQYRDGCLEIPTGPGLGVEIDEAMVVERARVGHDWKKPVWRNADGTVAEW